MLKKVNNSEVNYIILTELSPLLHKLVAACMVPGGLQVQDQKMATEQIVMVAGRSLLLIS